MKYLPVPKYQRKKTTQYDRKNTTNHTLKNKMAINESIKKKTTRSNYKCSLLWKTKETFFCHVTAEMLFQFSPHLKDILITTVLLPQARRMQRGRIKINLCVCMLWALRLNVTATGFTDSHHMTPSSIAQRQNDRNSIHLYIPTLDSAFNWVSEYPTACTLHQNNMCRSLLFIYALRYADAGSGGCLTKHSKYSKHMCSLMKWKLQLWERNTGLFFS